MQENQMDKDVVFELHSTPNSRVVWAVFWFFGLTFLFFIALVQSFFFIPFGAILIMAIVSLCTPSNVYHRFILTHEKILIGEFKSLKLNYKWHEFYFEEINDISFYRKPRECGILLVLKKNSFKIATEIEVRERRTYILLGYGSIFFPIIADKKVMDIFEGIVENRMITGSLFKEEGAVTLPLIEYMKDFILSK